MTDLKHYLSDKELADYLRFQPSTIATMAPYYFDDVLNHMVEKRFTSKNKRSYLNAN